MEIFTVKCSIGAQAKHRRCDVPYYNVCSPTTVAGEADSVSSLSASACHIGGQTDVNPGEQTLVYGMLWKVLKSGHPLFQNPPSPMSIFIHYLETPPPPHRVDVLCTQAPTQLLFPLALFFGVSRDNV